MEGSCFWCLILPPRLVILLGSFSWWVVESSLGHARAEEIHVLLVERKFTCSYNYLTNTLPSFRGIEPSSSAVDIKKAYRKAALRHHPDKVLYYFLSLLWLSLFSCLTVVMPQASTFLVRSENISDAVWRDITNEIRRDADYLFKIIGKAYAMLSDPTTVCITEISFIFFLCSCYWCCIFLLSFYQNFHVKWVGIILDKIYPAWCC